MFFSLSLIFIFYAFGTAKVDFFDLNYKFFGKIIVLEPGIHFPGMHSRGLERKTAQHFGDFRVDVAPFQVEDGLRIFVGDPAVEAVQGRHGA